MKSGRVWYSELPLEKWKIDSADNNMAEYSAHLFAKGWADLNSLEFYTVITCIHYKVEWEIM